MTPKKENHTSLNLSTVAGNHQQLPLGPQQDRTFTASQNYIIIIIIYESKTDTPVLLSTWGSYFDKTGSNRTPQSSICRTHLQLNHA